MKQEFRSQEATNQSSVLGSCERQRVEVNAEKRRSYDGCRTGG